MRIFDSKVLKTGCLGIIGAMLFMNLAWAQPSDMPPGKDQDIQKFENRVCPVLSAKLKLSPQQQAMLDENQKDNCQKIDKLKEETFTKRDELRKALDEPQLDMQKVLRIHGELKDLMDKMEDIHLMAVIEIRKILTPQQFAVFQTIEPDNKGPLPKDQKR